MYKLKMIAQVKMSMAIQDRRLICGVA